MTLHVGIAGGGLLGRLCAWQLLLNGCRVSLFEAGSLQHCPGAARTAAAMISPLSELADSDHNVYQMGMHSLNLWPKWLTQLRQAQQHPVHYYAGGSLVTAHRQDSSLLQQFANTLFHKLGEDSCQWLNQAELHDKEPDLSHFSQGLYLPSEAYLDNHALLDQLLSDIRALGAELHEYCEVESLSDNTLVTAEGTRSFDWLIDCRGIGAKDAFSQLRGVRGEVLWVQTHDVTLRHPVRFMHPKYKLYIVPKPNHQFIIGATEIESEDMSDISLRSSLELSSALYAVSPAFAEARVTKTDVNLRPALLNNHPQVQQQGQCLRANGLYRHGYLLAPVVVEAVLDRILGRTRSPFSTSLLHTLTFESSAS